MKYENLEAMNGLGQQDRCRWSSIEEENPAADLGALYLWFNCTQCTQLNHACSQERILMNGDVEPIAI